MTHHYDSSRGDLTHSLCDTYCRSLQTVLAIYVLADNIYIYIIYIYVCMFVFRYCMYVRMYTISITVISGATSYPNANADLRNYDDSNHQRCLVRSRLLRRRLWEWLLGYGRFCFSILSPFRLGTHSSIMYADVCNYDDVIY